MLELIRAETRWVHRRVERVELLNAVQMTRSVTADFSVPAGLAARLGLYNDEQDRAAGKTATRYIVPLGILPKAPPEDFSIAPAEAHRLTPDQTTRLVLTGLVPDVRACGAEPGTVLLAARRVIRAEQPSPALLDDFEATLGSIDNAAAERLRIFVRTLHDGYLLAVALKAEPGMPGRVTYTYRQDFDRVVGDVSDPPLRVRVPLPFASAPGPVYRIEMIAPEGLEIETASIVDGTGDADHPIESVNTEPGGGAFIQLRTPDLPTRPARAALHVTFGWPTGGIHHLATIAGATSTFALGAAVTISLLLDENTKSGSASALLAAPALVTGFALGFAATPITSKAVNRLRVAAFLIALFGVAGGVTIALLGENKAQLNARHITLAILFVTSLLVTGAFPVQAWLRKRAHVNLLADAA